MKTAREMINEYGYSCECGSLNCVDRIDAVEAAEEYADQFKTRSEKWSNFIVALNEKIDENDCDTCSLGEFVLNYFNFKLSYEK